MVVAAILIFGGLTRADIQNDDALYSFRAFDYLDHTNSGNRQTTPLQWLEEYPWWAYLSFHDHPPLVFIIQYLFFTVLGSSVLVMKLPFALAGLGSVFALYWLAKELYGYHVALLASLILAILSYHSWASKIGYLEPMLTFFLLLTLIFFVKGFKDNKFFIHFGIFLGLSFLTKYTTLFIIPPILLYLFIKDKGAIKAKEMLIGLVITLIIISPVIVYNFFVFQERGHFDLQLSAIFNQDTSADWPGISRQVSGLKFNSTIKVFFDNYSIAIFSLFVFSLLFMVMEALVNIRDIIKLKFKNDPLIFLLLLFGILMFSAVGHEARFLSVLNPFIALMIAIVLSQVMLMVNKEKSEQDIRLYLITFLAGIVILFEIFYNINSNILSKPFGEKGKHYSTYRLEAGGFNNLDEFLLSSNVIDLSSRKKIRSISDLSVDVNEMAGKDLFIYDQDLNWFSTLWYFGRYSTYYGNLFVPIADLASVIDPATWFSFFEEKDLKTVYYIKGKNDIVLASKDNQGPGRELEKIFLSQGAEKIDILNNNNELAFSLYKLNINN